MKALEVDLQATVGTLEIDIAFRATDIPVTIIGPNGAGKTTALRLILGAERPRTGHVAVDGEPVFSSRTQVDVERREIGFLPQNYGLFPHLDVVQNVAYGVPASTKAVRRQRAMEALHSLDADLLAGRPLSALSGGEKQRVALARALAANPRALLLDEPMAALDVGVRRDVRQFLSQRLRALKIPTVVVTHDRSDVEVLDGELVVMERGKVVQRGRVADVALKPATAFVAQFFSPNATTLK